MSDSSKTVISYCFEEQNDKNVNAHINYYYKRMLCLVTGSLLSSLNIIFAPSHYNKKKIGSAFKLHLHGYPSNSFLTVLCYSVHSACLQTVWRWGLTSALYHWQVRHKQNFLLCVLCWLKWYCFVFIIPFSPIVGTFKLQNVKDSTYFFS